MIGLLEGIWEKRRFVAMLEIEAIYANGILKPTQPVALEERQKVRLFVETKRSRIRQSAGLIPWKGSAEELERIAIDPEFSLFEVRNPFG